MILAPVHRSVSFSVAINPISTNRIYGTAPGGRKFKTPEARQYQQLIALAGRRAWKNAPPIEASVEVDLTFRCDLDGDNAMKLTLDALQSFYGLRNQERGAGIFVNDRQATDQHVHRREVPDEGPRVEISVWTVGALFRDPLAEAGE